MVVNLGSEKPRQPDEGWESTSTFFTEANTIIEWVNSYLGLRLNQGYDPNWMDWSLRNGPGGLEAKSKDGDKGFTLFGDFQFKGDYETRMHSARSIAEMGGKTIERYFVDNDTKLAGFRWKV
jgi:hypothetical protein